MAKLSSDDSEGGIEQIGPSISDVLDRDKRVQQPLPKGVKTASQYVATRSPERRLAAPPKAKRATLQHEVADPIGTKLAAAAAQGSEILDDDYEMPQAPKLEASQLPDAARGRLQREGRIPSVAQVKRDEQVHLSPRSRALATELDDVGDQDAQPQQPIINPPNDTDDQADKIKQAEHAIAESELAKLFAGKMTPKSPLEQALRNDQRRKKIEDRLQPLDIEDLVVYGSVSQSITLIPGKYSMTLRSLKHHELLFCLDYVQKQSGSDAYLQNLYDTALYTCALVEISGKVMPGHIEKEGSLDEYVDKKKFADRLGELLALSSMVVVDVGVQYGWFVERVAKLFSGEAIKNG